MSIMYAGQKGQSRPTMGGRGKGSPPGQNLEENRDLCTDTCKTNKQCVKDAKIEKNGNKIYDCNHEEKYEKCKKICEKTPV